MNKATRNLLTEAELELVARTDRGPLAELDEDELCELHDRIRRARNKYSKLHRRQASEQVRSDRSRGTAAASNQRTAAKAEVFEDALARVSRRLGSLASQRAKEIRAERLAASRSEDDPTPANRAARRAASGSTARSGATSTPNRRARTPAPVDKKVNAHTRASGARRQAKRDAR